MVLFKQYEYAYMVLEYETSENLASNFIYPYNKYTLINN